MNCRQARLMLAAYREYNQDQVENLALEAHLADCAECRHVFASYDLVGEQLRGLAPIEPSADAHSKLMHALAAEHARFIQQAPSSIHTPPVPAFLSPYIQKHKMTGTEALTSFTSAETGPLPVLPVSRTRKRYRPPLNHLAIVGLAAAFLMVLMTGGLTSLLLLASKGAPTAPGNQQAASIVTASQVSVGTYTTATSYPNVASAVANRQTIYYTAYSADKTHWMLAQLDNKTRISTPLLTNASAHPLIVLGSSQDWLVWLQFNDFKVPANKFVRELDTVKTRRGWQLQALYLGADPHTKYKKDTPVTLRKDTFDENTAPNWVHVPVQGTWFMQDSLLVAVIDAKGKARLLQYSLSSHTKITTTELATASTGRIITSPTATSDGAAIYWAEEWLTTDNVPHSNVWVQKTITHEQLTHGKMPQVPQKTVQKYLFRDDTMSFSPQVVNNVLFLLSTSSANGDASMGQGTPEPTATSSAGATPTMADSQPTLNTARVDPSIYGQPLTQAIQGRLFSFSVDTDSPLQLAVESSNTVTAIQAGSRFLLWQSTGAKAIGMYDVAANQPVTVGNAVPAAPTFLTVNENSVVWTTNPSGQDTAASATTPPTLTFSAFNWPAKDDTSMP